MALTVAIANKGRTDRLVKGAKLVQLQVTIGATGDYSSGFDLAAIGRAAGIKTVWHVLQATLRASAGTSKVLYPEHDLNTGKLRYYLAPAASATEITAGTHLAAGDILVLTLLGI